MRSPVVRVTIDRVVRSGPADTQPARFGALVEAALRGLLDRDGVSARGGDRSASRVTVQSGGGAGERPLAEAVAEAIGRVLGAGR